MCMCGWKEDLTTGSGDVLILLLNALLTFHWNSTNKKRGRGIREPKYLYFNLEECVLLHILNVHSLLNMLACTDAEHKQVRLIALPVDSQDANMNGV